MVFNKGLIHIIFRVFLLVGLIISASYTYLKTDLLITPLMFSFLVLLAITELVWHLNRQERSWIRFLEAIKYQDFNRVYQKQASKELSAAYELISQQMELLQSNNQAEYQLLQTVLGHISIGVACYQEDGNVVFTNKSFNTMLEIPGLIHIDKLRDLNPEIHNVLNQPSSQVSGWVDHKTGKKLLVKTESFRLKETNHILLSLTDIRNSLDTKELDSYQRLMSVMTHEIMNSTNPILSLIQVVNKKLIDGEKLITLSEKDQRNVSISLRAIEERTSGILQFVSAYKEISRPINLKVETVHSSDFLSGIEQLFPLTNAKEFVVSDQLKDNINVDSALLKQVIINLIKNANDALQNVDHGQIEVVLEKVKDEWHLSVLDNGEGVNPSDVSQIFIPFYTTKSEGSGIGLALARKIVKAHSGYLEYQRINDFTKFLIRLPTKG